MTLFQICPGSSFSEMAGDDASDGDGASSPNSFLKLIDSMLNISILLLVIRTLPSHSPRAISFASVSVAFLVLAGHYGQVAATTSEVENNQLSTWHWDWLNDLLQNVTIPIPQEQITEGPFAFVLKNGFCTHIHLDGIQLTMDSPKIVFNASASGLGLFCQMDYQVLASSIPITHGTVGATVSNSSADFSVGLDLNDVFLPANATTLGCGAHLNISSLDFTGSLSAYLIGLFSPAIKSLLNSELNARLCDAVTPLINTNLTQALHKFDKAIDPAMRPPSPTPIPSMPADLFDWSNSSIFHTLQTATESKAAQMINKAMNSFTNHTGKLDLAFLIPTKIFKFDTFLANFTLDLKSLSLTNLNEVGFVSLFEAEGGAELGTDLFLNEIGLEIKVHLDMDSHVAPQKLHYNLTLATRLSNLNMSLTDAFAISKSEFLGLKMIELLNFPCILNTIFSANITDMRAGYGSVVEFNVTGFDPDFDEIIDDSIDIFLRLFGPASHVLLANFGNALLREPINTAFTNIISTGSIPILVDEFEGATNDLAFVVQDSELNSNGFNSSCNPDPRPLIRGPTNFVTDKALNLIDRLLHHTISNITGKFSINKLIDMLTNDTGSITIPGTLVDIHLSDPVAGDFNLTLSNLELQSLNSFFALELLDVVSPSELFIDLGIGACNITQPPYCSPLHLVVDVGIDYSSSLKNLSADMSVDLGFTNLDISVIIDTLVSNQTLWDVSLQDLVDGGACLFAEVDRLQLKNLILNFTDISAGIVISAFESNYLHLESWSLDPYSTKKQEVSQANITVLLQDAISLFTPLIVQQVNNVIEGKLSSAKTECDGKQSSSKNGVVLIAEIVGGSVALLVIGSAAYVGRHRIKRISSRRASADHSNLRDATVGSMIMPEATLSDPEDKHLITVSSRERSASLKTGLHIRPQVPMWARIFVPVGLIAVFILFVTAHTSLGALVSLYIFYGDETLAHMDLFKFTLANSVTDMWNAKVYALSLLIAICSGGWPYLKTILLACAWYFPRNWLGQHKRDRLLMWLDVLGKWSLIDAYVLVLFIVAFRFHIANPELLIPGEIASVDVFVEPGFGIHGFLMAAVLQLILTHIIIHFHREAEGKHQHMREITGGTADAVRSHQFRMGASLRRRVQCTVLGQSLVTLLLVASVALVVFGSIIVSFSFEFAGAAAVVLELVNSPTSSGYSVLSLAKNVSIASLHPNDVGVRFLQVMYTIFVFAIPIAHLTTILVLWVWPLTVSVQRVFFIAAEVLNAWASLEVFVVSIIASILEISQFANFIVGDKCDQVNVLLKEVSEILPGLYDPSNEMVCFDVHTKLDNGCWVLFGASLGAIVIGQLVTRSCQHALNDRIKGLSQVQLADNDVEVPSSSDNEEKKCCSFEFRARILHALGIVQWCGIGTNASLPSYGSVNDSTQ
eukprot:c10620_g1_i1.p1 GENE.c10620_g1_i1~~c10620_g1_i1.p1  ORF type:complete len:1568 (-),score=387.24 c10620_g1_i1:170-4435(-)